MPFKTRPCMEYRGQGRYITSGRTVYEAERMVVTVPVGYFTDLATVPRPLWGWLSPHGTYEDAAVVHDFLCEDLFNAKEQHRLSIMSSSDADGLFRRIMREDGVPFVQRWLMWVGVRWGALFNECRREGWMVTAPLVLSLSVVFLVVVLLMALGVHAVVDLALRAFGF